MKSRKMAEFNNKMAECEIKWSYLSGCFFFNRKYLTDILMPRLTPSFVESSGKWSNSNCQCSLAPIHTQIYFNLTVRNSTKY